MSTRVVLEYFDKQHENQKCRRNEAAHMSSTHYVYHHRRTLVCLTFKFQIYQLTTAHHRLERTTEYVRRKKT